MTPIPAILIQACNQVRNVEIRGDGKQTLWESAGQIRRSNMAVLLLCTLNSDATTKRSRRERGRWREIDRQARWEGDGRAKPGEGNGEETA